MNPQALKPVSGAGHENDAPAPSLRRTVRKSALLNLVIVLTSLPVLILEGGPKVIVPTLEIMAGISVLIWTATFALFSLASLPRIFRAPESLGRRQGPREPAEGAGIDDPWLG